LHVGVEQAEVCAHVRRGGPTKDEAPAPGGGKGAEPDEPVWTYRGYELRSGDFTDRGRDVADAILGRMQRGVTSLEGRGMYEGSARAVLMCALTITEIPTVRALVQEVDPAAFVIVTPAHEVYGVGFEPFESPATN
jgi:hypothetical protein